MSKLTFTEKFLKKYEDYLYTHITIMTINDLPNLNVEKIAKFHANFLRNFYKITTYLVLIYLFTTLLPKHLSQETIIIILLVSIIYRMPNEKIIKTNTKKRRI